MRNLNVIVILFVLGIPRSFAQTPAPKPEPGVDAPRLVDEWFRRFNALDDWHITMGGREEPEAVVNRLVELYRPEILQFVGPNKDQLGPVTLSGHDGIRKWAGDIARTYVQLAFRLDPQTSKEITENILHVSALPWGGTAVSVEFTAVYSNREDRRKFMAPGAAFFQFAEDGKIRRLRLFLLKDETVEIVP